MQVPLRGTCGTPRPGLLVRFTVTPLGGARSDIADVVDRIVQYLQPPPAPPVTDAPPGPGKPEGPFRYYADSGEEPGRWLGAGAQTAGLTGEVQGDDLAAVLSGRDPRTGERLLSARGSAGRRQAIGAGHHTMVSPTGEKLYDESDAAAVLGATKAEVTRMIDVGAGLAMSRALAALGATLEPPPDGSEASYLVPVISGDGNRWVTESELSRCVDARSDGVDAASLTSTGADGDLFSIAEAARLGGVTSRYLRRLAKHGEDHRTDIETALAAGRRPRQAYLIAYRGSRGQWLVTRRHLTEFLERRRPPAVRVGFDLTLTTEKSLGVLALLGRPRGRTGRPGRRSRTATTPRCNWLEAHAATGRVAGHPVDAAGWTVASFRHLTSRALDPFPHHHNVVANTVCLPDGTHRALDARGLYRHAQAASALATAEMRHQLSARLGVRWRPGRKGGWEIAGIDDAVLSEFSQRRHEIDDALQELEEAIGRGAHPAEVEHIVLRTRPAKNHTPAADLTGGWRQRAAALGFDRDAAAACVGHDVPIAEPDVETLFASLAAPSGICASGSVFTRADALVALADHPVATADGPPQPLLVGAAGVEALTDEFLASPHVVRVAGSGAELFTTVEMLEVQDRIVSRFRQGLHRGSGLVSRAAVSATLDTHPHLSGEQRGLVESWCGQGHQFQAAIGRAGAGKTTTVAAAADAWTAAGYRVVGAAVKGEAARTLADDHRHSVRDRRLVPRPSRPAGWAARRPDRPGGRRSVHPRGP